LTKQIKETTKDTKGDMFRERNNIRPTVRNYTTAWQGTNSKLLVVKNSKAARRESNQK